MGAIAAKWPSPASGEKALPPGHRLNCRRHDVDTRLTSIPAIGSAQAADGAVERGLSEAGHDPALPLRIPGCDERVEAVRHALRAAYKLGLRRLAALLVLARRRHRRDRGGVDRGLAPLEGAGAVTEADLVRRRTVVQHHGADVLADVALHRVRHASSCKQDHHYGHRKPD